MAVRDRFLIAPYETGLQANLKNWLIPDDAFQVIRNAYVYRGRVTKRFGSKLLDPNATVPQLSSRLRVSMAGAGAGFGITDGAGNATVAIPGSDIATLGKMFSIGNVMYTVYQAGVTQAMLKTDGTTTATYDTTTGIYNFVGAPITTTIYYYPALPVMGLLTLETASISDEMIIGFDTQFAYRYTANAWERLDSEAVLGNSQWTGSDSQFFWGCTWLGLNAGDRRFFVTNFNSTDKIRTMDANPASANYLQWSSLTYAVLPATNMDTARMLIPFKSRLIALNTKETTGGVQTNYVNRMRWSTEFNIATAATSFLVTNKPGAGWLDAATLENIVSAKIVKDRLIVFFEQSTWEVVYTGNEVRPFIWQKIDSELGAESTFASVLFDTDIVGIGNTGIYACNGAYVKRIDERIPNLISEIHNKKSGVQRVYGVRDFYAEMIYWTFPSQADDPKYPNQILAFNYSNHTWAQHDDTITCFGYYQPASDLPWSDIAWPWSEWNAPWDDGQSQALSKNVIAGNQEGFTFLVDTFGPRNAAALQITNMTVAALLIELQVLNHNIRPGEYVLIESCLGATTANKRIYEVKSATTDTFTISEPHFTGTYTGGGTVARVSRMEIATKDYSFYVKEGRNLSLPRVDFLVDSTTNGEVTVAVRPSTSAFYVEKHILEMFPYAISDMEKTQERLWHSIYMDAEGMGIQMFIYHTPEQMLKYTEDIYGNRSYVALENFVLHAMVLHARRTSENIG